MLRDNCTGVVRGSCSALTRERVERVASRFATEDCFPEPDRELATVVELFDLLRQTFVQFFEHLTIEEILLY